MRIWLKELRLKAGETLSETAEAIGMTRQGYWYIEAGKRNCKMTVARIGLLADHFGMDMATLAAAEAAYEKGA